ncbi:MAG: serine protease [Spirulinaceae cyanobacterium]
MIPEYKILKEYPELVKYVIDFFASKATNPNVYKQIREVCKNNKSLEYSQSRKLFLDLGYFHKTDVILFGVKTRKDNLIDNCIFGFSYIAEKYRNSVFKIEVEKYEGVINIGTGFLYYTKDLIITAKHVVQAKDTIIIKSILDIDNNLIDFDRDKIRIFPDNDIAFIPLTSNYEAEGLYPGIEFDILDDVITLEYPKVSTTKAAYLVAHRGEINSKVENYWGNQLLLFSAKTSPGSSGSPIINRMGLFVGVVSENLYRKEASEDHLHIPYHAGIPSSTFIK